MYEWSTQSSKFELTFKPPVAAASKQASLCRALREPRNELKREELKGRTNGQSVEGVERWRLNQADG
jgi:hypothetical protein